MGNVIQSIFLITCISLAFLMFYGLSVMTSISLTLG